MLFARLPNYPRYRIYINGDIYSERAGKNLKPKMEINGYMRIRLYNENGQNMFSIHRLMGILFFPCNKSFDKVQIDHINRDRHDNSIYNLRWCDRSINNLNKKFNPTNTGFPFISKSKSKCCKTGFVFRGGIRRNSKRIIEFKRAKLEDAVKVMREFIIKNYDLVMNELPEETKIIIIDAYNLSPL